MAYDVYQAAATLILKRYSMRLLTADEGGLAPPCESAEEMIETAIVAIKDGRLQAGRRCDAGAGCGCQPILRHGRYQLDGARLDRDG